MGRRVLLSIILLTSIMITTIVYSAFNTTLQIKGDAIVRSIQDIRITNVTVSNRTNGAYETFNNKYSKDTTSLYATLPASSSITYTVEITNKVNSSYLIDSITQQSHTNSNVNVDISLNVNDIVNGNSTKTFTITLTNNTQTEQEETLVYKYQFKLNSFTVTFDANGGQVSTPSKTVSYGSTYGNLPEPTRTGYTLAGWNGKNLFNKDATPFKEYYSLNGDDETEGNNPEYSIYQIDVKPNTTYTITNSGKSVRPGYVIYDANGTSLAHQNYNGSTTVTFTTPSTASYMRFSVVKSSSSYRYDADIFQIEEGSEATPYEPYYVTSSTKVTQPKNHTLTAIWEPNTYTVTFDYNGNLLYGLDNKSETTTDRMKYSINNGTVTVTATQDDGYGYTTGRVYLEANKTYIFNCTTDAPFGSAIGDTQQAALMLNGSPDIVYYVMESKNNYEFTPTVSGTYWLRLDVNQNGQTHTFSNISIKEKNTTKQVTYGSTYGTLPEPTRTGYTFKGWNGKNLFNEEEILMGMNGATYDNEYYIFTAGAAHNKYSFGINQLDNFKSNTQYTLSYIGYSVPESNMQTNFRFVFKYTDDTEDLFFIDADRIYEEREHSFTSRINKTIKTIYMTYGFTGTIYMKNVQLEEGSTATAYEPYYVTSNTTVTQAKDHTLTAIWEQN